MNADLNVFYQKSLKNQLKNLHKIKIHPNEMKAKKGNGTPNLIQINKIQMKKSETNERNKKKMKMQWRIGPYTKNIPLPKLCCSHPASSSSKSYFFILLSLQILWVKLFSIRAISIWKAHLTLRMASVGILGSRREHHI